MKFRFPIFIIDEDYRSENASGLGIRALSAAIEAEGVEVIGVTSYGDLSSFAQQQSRASAFILSIDDEEFDVDSPEDGPARSRTCAPSSASCAFNADIPIYLYGETRTSEHIPNDILRELHGFIHMFEDTPEFVARHIIREAQLRGQPAAAVLPRAGEVRAGRLVFLALPRPLRRRGLPEEPVGQMFHQFFGENMLRADVCNAVDELGQLLDHTGPVAESELNAARIFHADHCYFVTNGTSTSNRWCGRQRRRRRRGRGPQLPQVDPARHHHDGRDPVFLRPTRNHLGIIGPIPLEEFHPDNIRKKIEANPFAREAVNKNPRILTLTQSTYDGVIYNVEMIRNSWAATSTRCTSTKPGCRTRRSTSSTRTCTRSARTARAARTRWCSPRTPRTSCWPAFLRPRRSSCRSPRPASWIATCSTRRT